jgi:hypothetical protein
MSQVQQDIAAREYHVSWQDQPASAGLSAAWHAPNRAHSFRTYFTPPGIQVIPREEQEPSWELKLSLLGYGRGDKVWPLPEGQLSPTENRVDYSRGGIEEWYVNSPAGLKQGFLLPAPPEDVASWNGTQPLAAGSPPPGRQHDLSPEKLVYLDLVLTGDLSPVISTDGQAIEFTTPAGARVARYTELKVTDAGGREVPAWMEGFSGNGDRGIRLVMDASEAVYPLTIDPLLTSPSWTGESNQAYAYYGYSVGTAGDVNGDGYSDIIVGAYTYDNGETDEGQVYVYLGSASGVEAAAAWTVEGNQIGANLASSVSTAGDVNGDGYADVIVGATPYDNGETDEGRAYVYLGSALGLEATPAWTVESNQASAYLGRVATAGDVNGDGYADVIVGASRYDNLETDEGTAFVFHGSASGLSGAPNATPLDADWTVESDQADAYLGSAATAGDVNGDGYGDVIVGASGYDNGESNEGRALAYLGSASGLAGAPNATPLDAAWAAESDQADAGFGGSVATAGDVNGDGYADVIVGAPSYDNGETNEGMAFVYHGSVSGLVTRSAWTAESDNANALFGISVATAGDINGDGYADVIVGARGYTNPHSEEGLARSYLGSASGLETTPHWTVEANVNWARLGVSVGTAGDVNGDGYSDVVVGANLYSNGQTDEGRAFVYHGSASGLAASPAWTAEGDQANAWFGYSVGTAGDVNGDGYADVIVGAYNYGNGEIYEGMAFVYHSSASGLAAGSAWTAEGDQANALFGFSVATAGDVNGDGYADVIVGAFRYDNGQTDEGMAFVYYGNDGGGLALTPQQRRFDDTAPIAPTGWSDARDSFRLSALGRTPFGRNSVKLEWEVKPLGTLFDGTGTGQSAAWIAGC